MTKIVADTKGTLLRNATPQFLCALLDPYRVKSNLFCYPEYYYRFLSPHILLPYSY